jgi:hypothetical protein
MSASPADVFAAVVHRLAPNADEAQHMIDHGGPAARTVGRAVLTALRAGRADTEAGCRAFLAALAPAADEAARLAKDGNDRQRQVSTALLAARAGAKAVDWRAKPAAQPVAIAAAFGDLTLSATAPTPAAVKLERAGAADLAASCGWRVTGAGAARLAQAAGPAVFAAGARQVDVLFSFAAAPGMTSAETVAVAITGPFDGLKPGAPASVRRRLLPPAGPPRSVVSVAQGFDAVVLSANAPTTGRAALARTGGADALEVPVVATGLRDGDLAAPVGPARFEAGASQAGVTLQFGPGTPGAPDRAARLAIDAGGGAFDTVDPAGFDFAVREPAVVAAKGTITFTSPLGTVLRDPARETVILVEVAREGVSTHKAATVPIVDVVLPPDILKVVGPAEFRAGQRIGHAPVVLHPYGAGARPAAPRRTPGRADLVATEQFDLGEVPSLDFIVQDGQVIAPPPDKWWSVPGGNLSGNAWNLGVNSTGWNKATVDRYAREVGRRPDAFCAANHHGAVIFGGWDEFHAQTQFNNSSGFGGLLQCAVRGKTWHILNFYTHPVSIPLATLARPGPHDAEYVKAGQELRASVARAGLDDWQLALRINKEGNQDAYLTSASQAHLYGLAVGRAIKGIRQGYGMTSRGRLRFSFSPARGLIVGPLEGFCSFDDDGSCLFDAASASTHPADQLSREAGKPFAVQVAAVQAWLRGDYKDGYSYLNSNPDYSITALVDKYGLAFAADEWSPRFEPKLYCAIAEAAIQAIHDFFTSVQDRLAWDCVFQANILDEHDIVPGWAAMSRRYKALWGGR